MKIHSFSERQLEVLSWWSLSSPHRNKQAVICDGAVRSGKTMCMGLSFVLWSMSAFSGARFGLCGKSIGSLRRNLLDELIPTLKNLGFCCRDLVSKNRITITLGDRKNTYLVFGGRDESSAALIQGVTLAGVLLDEVAIMPRSFVEQAIARCSIEGAKMWFNCNPESPEHWFYKEWISKTEERNALYLHFLMKDNPSLSSETLKRYMSMYTGSFHRRFVEGLWTVAEGRVYDFFDDTMVCENPPSECSEYVISCDYGTVNPASFGLWGKWEGTWYRLTEFYHNSRTKGFQMTDSEYAKALIALADGRKISAVICDPSAASFMETLSRFGMKAVKAKNDVLTGIRHTAEALRAGEIVICSSCVDFLREISVYIWEHGASDKPQKQNDHAMDDMRYFVETWLMKNPHEFAVFTAERNSPSNNSGWRRF